MRGTTRSPPGSIRALVRGLRRDGRLQLGRNNCAARACRTIAMPAWAAGTILGRIRAVSAGLRTDDPPRHRHHRKLTAAMRHRLARCLPRADAPGIRGRLATITPTSWRRKRAFSADGGAPWERTGIQVRQCSVEPSAPSRTLRGKNPVAIVLTTLAGAGIVTSRMATLPAGGDAIRRPGRTRGRRRAACKGNAQQRLPPRESR